MTKHTKMPDPLDMPIGFGRMLKFALPTIAAQVFMSFYSAVDGLFVANLVGTDALSAVNIVMPLVMVIIAASAMLSSGGRALVAARIGEGRLQEARQDFTLALSSSFCIGLAMCLSCFAFLDPLLVLLGSNQALLELCRSYAIPILCLGPVALLGMVVDVFFMVEGKPGLGATLSVAGGLVNIALDYLFIAVFGWGVAGAGLATVIGYSVPAVFGVVFFALNRKGSLFIVRPVWRGASLAKMMGNGSSEMVMLLSVSVVSAVMNNSMMRLAGSDGVAAIGIIEYSTALLTAVFYGYDYGVSPIASYNFGKGDRGRLRRYNSINLRVAAFAGVVSFALSLVLAPLVAGFFPRPGTHVFELAVSGFRLYALSFLAMGISDYASSFFTALNGGLTSAAIAFMRTMVFTLGALLVLPNLFGLTGFWLAVPAAEFAGLAVSTFFLVRKRRVYGYA